MARLRDILHQLELIAPARFAFAFDKVGLQVGSENAEVRRAAVSLDRSLGAIRFAADSNCELLVAHHPLIFSPLEQVTDRTHTSRSALLLAELRIAFVAAHTNWDSARGGVNDILAEMLHLQEVRAFGSGAEVVPHKLVFFAPQGAVEGLIDRLAEVGAGRMGLYSRCSFQNEGLGEFIGDVCARPAVGKAGQQESVEEIRVEMLLPPGTEKAAERELVRHHPYEQPAYDVYPLRPYVEQPAGRVGKLSEKMSFGEFVQEVDRHLDTVSVAWGSPDKIIRKVAVVGGAADSEWMAAQRAGADVFLTGEVKQHIALESTESGLCILASGHYATEHPGAAALKLRLQHACPDVEWLLYTPPQGMHGRPL